MMKVLLKLFAVLMALALLAAAAAWYTYDGFINKPLATTEGMVFEIKPGTSIRSLVQDLQTHGVFSKELEGWLFLAHARLKNQAHLIKAGEYQLEADMTATALLKKFVKGKALQHKLAIIEGKTFKQMIAEVRAHPQLEKTLTSQDYDHIMVKLGAAANMQPEGWFFPDTYNFPRNTTDFEFLQRSYQAMQEYLQKAWDGRDPNPYIKTPYEALILASIVEKETGVPKERPLIARVFLNRLEKGMLLQTDPTVIYGMGDKYDGNIRKADLKRDTPYNTYTRAGLPPTPIAIPSKAAIDAVMHPADGDVFYFVAKEPGGESYFSKTYPEHQQAVRKYILNRK